MEELALAPLRTLDLEPGDPPFVAAASGLLWSKHWFYVAADDQLFLAAFPTTGTAPGQRLRLFEGELPNEPAARKAQKPDLEALTFLPRGKEWMHGGLLALPSGSSATRTRGAWLALEPDGAATQPPHRVQFDPLYERLRSELGALNLEGAAQVGNVLFVANRGNNRAPSALVELDLTSVCQALERGAPVGPAAFRRWTPLELGKVHGVPLTPTDLCAVQGALLVCAAAEDTANAWDDGQTVGAAVFALTPELAVRSSVWLGAGKKPEGLWAWSAGDALELRLVCDADDPSQASPLLAGRWRPGG